MKAGASCIPVDPTSSTEEVVTFARAGGAAGIVVSEEMDREHPLLAAKLLEAGLEETKLWRFDEVFAMPDEQTEDERMALLPTRVHPQSVASLIFTSGTTGRPKGVISGSDPARAFVACHGEDSVAVVDLSDPAIETRIPVGPDPVALDVVRAPRYGPHVAALSPDGTSLAVGCSESAEVRFLDVESGRLANVILPTQGVPQRPSWSTDGLKLYVPISRPEMLVVFDVTTGAELVRRSFAAGECTRPVEVVVHETGVWIACEGDPTDVGAVLALDPLTLETLRRADAGVRPTSLAVIE